jgi:signal transduction histidine kinase
MMGKFDFSATLSELDMITAVLDCSEKLMTVYGIFENNFSIPGIIILKNGSYYFMLSKSRFHQVMSKQYMFDLFSKRNLQFFYTPDYSDNSLILDESTTIIEATRKALYRDEKDRYEPIIVLDSKGEYRLLPVHTLLLAQNEIQTSMLKLITDANEFKKDVFRVVAHDLRNPLSIIIGYSKLICEKSHDEEQIQIFAEQISLAGSKMNNLIGDFLTATINDSTNIELNYSVFDIIAFIENIVKSFENILAAKNQAIILNSTISQLFINADKTKISEVIDNLISNASKYSDYRKNIIITISKDENSVILKFIDEGPGLTDQDKEIIFNKFQKLSAKPTGNESSTGLGLYIVKRIVERHEGLVWVESELGKGSTFIVSLPLLLLTNEIIWAEKEALES